LDVAGHAHLRSQTVVVPVTVPVQTPRP